MKVINNSKQPGCRGSASSCIPQPAQPFWTTTMSWSLRPTKLVHQNGSGSCLATRRETTGKVRSTQIFDQCQTYWLPINSSLTFWARGKRHQRVLPPRFNLACWSKNWSLYLRCRTNQFNWLEERLYWSSWQARIHKQLLSNQRCPVRATCRRGLWISLYGCFFLPRWKIWRGFGHVSRGRRTLAAIPPVLAFRNQPNLGERLQ